MLIIVIRQLFIGHSTLDGGTHRFRHFIRLDTSSIFKIELFSMCLNFDFVREFVSADRSEKGCAASAASFDIEFIENRRPTIVPFLTTEDFQKNRPEVLSVQ